MGIEELKQDSMAMTAWQRHRFFVLIVGVIIVASVLVAIGMSLYRMSGAEQVDLSRPGYQSIQKEAQRGEDLNDTFPATGELNDESFSSFYRAYDRRAKRVSNGGSFDSKALDEESLHLITADEGEPLAE